MKHLLIASALFLTACGMEDKNSDAENQASMTYGPAIAHQPNEKEVVLEYRKEGARMAISLADTADLPACNNANTSQLAYVKSVKTFFECANGVWEEIVIEGVAKNEAPRASDSPEGEDPISVHPNAWKDPIQGSEWLIGGIMERGGLISYPPCTGDYRLPTSSELLTALSHGLNGAAKPLGDYQGFWTSETHMENFAGSQALSQVGYDIQGQYVPQTLAAKLGAACLKAK